MEIQDSSLEENKKNKISPWILVPIQVILLLGSGLGFLSDTEVPISHWILPIIYGGLSVYSCFLFSRNFSKEKNSLNKTGYILLVVISAPAIGSIISPVLNFIFSIFN